MQIVIESASPAQLWLWDDLCRPVRDLGDDPSKIIIGLDDSQIPARAIITSVEDGADSMIPYGHAIFETLGDFETYWDRNWNYSGVYLAVPDDPADPLGIRAYLERERYPLEEYPLLAHRVALDEDMTLQDLGICREFERPYVLALYALYRRKAARKLGRICVRLWELQCTLRELWRDAHRLSGALATTRWEDESPF